MNLLSLDEENFSEPVDCEEEIFGEDYFFNEKTAERKIKVYALVIYDIIENKKRTRFAKFMNAFGTRVQKSCFEVALPLSGYNKMMKHIGKFCGEEDSIRVYRLSGKNHVYTWGKMGIIEDEEVIIV